MSRTSKDHRILDIETLERIYGTPAAASVLKEVDYLYPHYRAFIDPALPSLGRILEDLGKSPIDGGQYDKELPERLRTTMY